jgi:hypothetical protein
VALWPERAWFRFPWGVQAPGVDLPSSAPKSKEAAVARKTTTPLRTLPQRLSNICVVCYSVSGSCAFLAVFRPSAVRAVQGPAPPRSSELTLCLRLFTDCLTLNAISITVLHAGKTLCRKCRPEAVGIERSSAHRGVDDRSQVLIEFNPQKRRSWHEQCHSRPRP